MNEQQETEDFADAIRRADACGPVILDMDTAAAVNLIAVLQLASRHPTAMLSGTVRQVMEMARKLQDNLARRDERLGRYLERGWHPVFDVLREEEVT